LNEQSDDEGCEEEGDGLERLEMQSHVPVHDPAQHDQERGDKERDLQTAANGDTDGEIHFVLVRDHDSRNVFCGVAHDWDEDETNERFANVRRLDDGVDAVNQVFGANGHGNCDDDQKDTGCPGGQEFCLFVFTSVSFVKQLGMRLKLEDQIHDVDEEEDDGCSMG
jgi:hypothetical protein